ncbi:hypothetical protein N7452_000942 [Penicillium brevicompactum]|uniref:Uncharacterized protein n=1 Tax=Penicillium brevicompactum TaxID=5074 RepID=A0A9W9UNS4_PENBR|nr:hypothetical protein N7452_000942 [Penicillium brevicompactum]
MSNLVPAPARTLGALVHPDHIYFTHEAAPAIGSEGEARHFLVPQTGFRRDAGTAGILYNWPFDS